MSARKYEMKMPERYRELTDEEMEYGGGFLNIPASIGLFVVGTIATVAGNYLDDDRLKAIGTACTIIGIASTGIGAVTSAIKIARAAPTLAKGVSALTKSEKTFTWAVSGGVSMDAFSAGLTLGFR